MQCPICSSPYKARVSTRSFIVLIVLRDASSRFLLRDCSQFLLREDCSHTANALLSPNGHLWVLKFKLLLRKNNGVNKPTSQLDHRYIRSDVPTGRRSSTMYLMHHPTSVEVHTHRASSSISTYATSLLSLVQETYQDIPIVLCINLVTVQHLCTSKEMFLLHTVHYLQSLGGQSAAGIILQY